MTFEDTESAEPNHSADSEQSLTDPISDLEQERDQFKALAQRSQADFVNYKRRVEEERWALARNASHNVISRLLPIIDDLQRAVGALPAEADEAWGSGIKLISQNIVALIATEGITEFEPPPGEAFDPVQHEAVSYQPSGDQVHDSILVTTRKGYRSADRVLRAAQVVVARDPEDDNTLPGGSGPTVSK